MGTPRVLYQPRLTTSLVRNLIFRDRLFTVVDVGASGGIDGHWNVFRPDLAAFAFEPLMNECERLNAQETGSGVHYFDYFVGADDYDQLLPSSEREGPHAALGDTPFKRTSAAKAQRLARLTPEVMYSEGAVAPVVTSKRTSLDRFFAERPDAIVDFIKIDTDGHDYEVIVGARDVLMKRDVLGLFVECQFHGLVHPHSNIFSNIDRELRSLGFTLFDLEVYRYTRECLPGRFVYPIAGQTVMGQVLWGDALYLRDAAAPNYEVDWKIELSPDKLVKLACLFEIYGMPDCAAELFVVHRERMDQVVDVQWCLDTLAVEADPGTKDFVDTNRRFEASPASFYPKEASADDAAGASSSSERTI